MFEDDGAPELIKMGTQIIGKSCSIGQHEQRFSTGSVDLMRTAPGKNLQMVGDGRSPDRPI